MKRILYHGSDKIIMHPAFGAGKPYNDYGLGFYCTESIDMAREWSVGKDRDGYANSYGLDCDGLRILDLNAPATALCTGFRYCSKIDGLTHRRAWPMRQSPI